MFDSKFAQTGRVQVHFNGNTMDEVIAQARALVAAWESSAPAAPGKSSHKTPKR